MGRFVPVNLDITIAEKTPPKHPGGKVYYDGKQCWQYKVVYDKPGAYTFTAPSQATCVRSVLIGGGGKPSHQSSTCCSYAGAGGSYSEKCMAVGGGTEMCIVVGKQEQDTTLSCEGTPVHTAGGATCCNPGTASGGDWDSRGGRPGYSCNYCGGSYSHYCGSCTYYDFTTCCGYCVVYAYKVGGGSSACCNINVAGGASAGTPKNLCGGSSSNTCGWINTIAGGGGGLGSVCCQQVWHYNCCYCICLAYCTGYRLSQQYPPSNQGGAGSKNTVLQGCRAYTGECMGGVYKPGEGGTGGPDDRTDSFSLEWGYRAMCMYPYGGGYQMPEVCMKNPSDPPCKVDWWDISDICGSGSPGTAEMNVAGSCAYGIGMYIGQRPENSGEGAGTGGIGAYYCQAQSMGWGLGLAEQMVNWCRVCNLGQLGWEDNAWYMRDALVPFHLTCAGTLGGSGGTGFCKVTQRAGAGGGGGQGKCHILCICYGTNYDCCNGSGPLLAFSPCLLDTLVSNAGTGMAIIYYKEA